MGGGQAADGWWDVLGDMTGAVSEPGFKRRGWYQPVPDTPWPENSGKMLGTGPWEDATAQWWCPDSFLQEGPAVLFSWEASGVA